MLERQEYEFCGADSNHFLERPYLCSLLCSAKCMQKFLNDPETKAVCLLSFDLEVMGCMSLVTYHIWGILLSETVLGSCPSLHILTLRAHIEEGRAHNKRIYCLSILDPPMLEIFRRGKLQYILLENLTYAENKQYSLVCFYLIYFYT